MTCHRTAPLRYAPSSVPKHSIGMGWAGGLPPLSVQILDSPRFLHSFLPSRPQAPSVYSHPRASLPLEKRCVLTPKKNRFYLMLWLGSARLGSARQAGQSRAGQGRARRGLPPLPLSFISKGDLILLFRLEIAGTSMRYCQPRKNSTTANHPQPPNRKHEQVPEQASAKD